MIKIERVLSVLLISLVLVGCTSTYDGIPMAELKQYSSTNDVKTIFADYKEDFLCITELLEREDAFFFNNDDSIRPSLTYDYSEYFTDDEWGQIKDFLELTGLYSIEYERIFVDNATRETRFGKRMEYHFQTVDMETMCTVTHLTNSDDQEIEKNLFKQNTKFPGTVDTEILEEGWYFFVEHWDGT